MTRIIIPTICAVPVPLAAAAQALPSRIEVSGSAAATRVFRTEDQSFGTVINPGLGFEWRVWPRLGLGVQWSHATGLEPRVTTCASFPGASCTGIGRSGVLSATLVSATAAWYFEGNARAQPYVIGGVGVISSRSVASVTFGSNNVQTITETEQRDRGMGVTAAAGVRVQIGQHLVLRPEWRIYDGSLLGGANLSAMRTSVAVGYGW